MTVPRAFGSRHQTACRSGRGGARSGRLQLGAIALFVPAAFLLAFALWQRQGVLDGRLSFGNPSEPERTAVSGPVIGWSGRLERPSRPPLMLRLETLHPFPARQGFDAAALAARFRRGEVDGLTRAAETARDPDAVGRMVTGPQPWRLTVSAEVGTPEGRTGSSRSDLDPGVSQSEPFEAVVIEDLTRLRIDGLEPLVRDVESGAVGASAGQSADPLETLFRFPESDLREGETCDLIFWGIPPSGTLRVHVPGVRSSDGTMRVEVVELRPLSRAASRASEAIARLDARSTEAPR